MEEINFDYVIEKALNIPDESIRAGILCELAKSIINCDEDTNEILKRLDKIVDTADSFKEERYSSIVLGEVALVSAKVMGIPVDSDLYVGMIENENAEKAFIERIKKIKEEIDNEISNSTIEELSKIE